MNKLVMLATAAIFSTAFASAVLAEKTAFTADLKGAAQVPPIDSAGTGKADVTYDDASKMLTWTITYSGLRPSPLPTFMAPQRRARMLAR